MRGEQNFERLEQGGRLSGAFQDVLDFVFVPVGHGRNDSFFVGEIAINQADADARLPR